jgi:hypothetical protein
LQSVSTDDDEFPPALGEETRALKRFKLSGHSFSPRADTSCNFGVPRHG